MPVEAHRWLWDGLIGAIDEALWEIRDGQPQTRVAPALAVPMLGHPPFETEQIARVSVEGIRALLRLEAPLAQEAMEAWLLSEEDPLYLAMLAERCARIGRLYAELTLRLGVVMALLFLRWELRLLRHRGSVAAAPLAFGPLRA